MSSSERGAECDAIERGMLFTEEGGGGGGGERESWRRSESGDGRRALVRNKE